MPRWPLALGALAVGAAAGVTAGLLGRRPPAPPRRVATLDTPVDPTPEQAADRADRAGPGSAGGVQG